MAPSHAVTPARMLAIYLRHHLAASKGGLDLFERSASRQSNPETRRELRVLADEVTQDRQRLAALLQRLGIPRPRMAEILVSVSETVGRLKPNGTLIRRSPLSDVVELEGLSAAVEAKRLGWVTLRVVSERDGRLDTADFDELIRRASDQQDHVELLRRQAVASALTPAVPTH